MQFLKSLLIISAVTSMANAADPDDYRWNNLYKNSQSEFERARRERELWREYPYESLDDGASLPFVPAVISLAEVADADDCSWNNLLEDSQNELERARRERENCRRDLDRREMEQSEHFRLIDQIHQKSQLEKIQKEQHEQREAQERADLAEAFRQQQLQQAEEKAREDRETQEAIRAVAEFLEQEIKLKTSVKDNDLLLAGQWYKALSKEDQMNTEARVKCLEGHGFSEEYARVVDDMLIGDDSEEN